MDSRHADEVERFRYDEFESEASRTFRAARSVIQSFAEAVGQCEILRSGDDDGHRASAPGESSVPPAQTPGEVMYMLVKNGASLSVRLVA